MTLPGDILDDFDRQRRQPAFPTVEAIAGVVVEDRASGFCGGVVAATAQAVTLRDRHGRDRQFRYKPGGFLVDGRPVTLVRPAATLATAPATARTTNSGSLATTTVSRARTARASRIWVEGKHDAELLEHVWGDDLRELGIVVEPMQGIDDLPVMVAGFGAGPQRRLGVLVDHLVPGSKESRVAATVTGASVLVVGHPFVDVWAGIWPRVVGRDEWPVVPMGVPWKDGVCAALGADPAGFWPWLRNRVGSFADLRPELVGAVERLIDFVSAGAD
jgi:hypothetical protein